MKFHAVLLMGLFVFADVMLVRCWFRHDPRYIGWIMLAGFSTIGAIAALGS